MSTSRTSHVKFAQGLAPRFAPHLRRLWAECSINYSHEEAPVADFFIFHTDKVVFGHISNLCKYIHLGIPTPSVFILPGLSVFPPVGSVDSI